MVALGKFDGRDVGGSVGEDGTTAGNNNVGRFDTVGKGFEPEYGAEVGCPDVKIGTSVGSEVGCRLCPE